MSDSNVWQKYLLLLWKQAPTALPENSAEWNINLNLIEVGSVWRSNLLTFLKDFCSHPISLYGDDVQMSKNGSFACRIVLDGESFWEMTLIRGLGKN